MWLGMLIPRLGEDFVDRPLNVLLLDEALLTITKSLWTTCLTSLLLSRKRFPLLVVPSSDIEEVMDLIELYIWSVVSSGLIIINFI